jgi:TATA-binding protein-associated factor Taf7
MKYGLRSNFIAIACVLSASYFHGPRADDVQSVPIKITGIKVDTVTIEPQGQPEPNCAVGYIAKASSKDKEYFLVLKLVLRKYKGELLNYVFVFALGEHADGKNTLIKIEDVRATVPLQNGSEYTALPVRGKIRESGGYQTTYDYADVEHMLFVNYLSGKANLRAKIEGSDTHFSIAVPELEDIPAYNKLIGCMSDVVG